MMKTILALFFFCCFALVQKVAAQVVATDSAGATQPAKPAPRADRLHTMWDRRPGFWPMSAPFPGKAARHARSDASQFRLPKNLIPKVRDGEITATSDYFKPTAASTSLPELLADSAYVKDYRYYAYNTGSRQMLHPVGTGLIIGGGVLVVISGFVALFIELSHVHIHQSIE
jgi:hypothetical protein